MIINIRKSDNLCVDIGQVYDTRTHENLTFPDGTIPPGEKANRYKKVGAAIVRRTAAELIEIPAERRAQLLSRINAVPDAQLPPAIKAILRDLLG